MKKNKNYLKIGIACLVLSFSCQSGTDNSSNQSDLLENAIANEPTYTSDEDMAYFSENKISDEQVFVNAEIIKVLADDEDGARHQKFLIQLVSGQTILVAHNIDLANRVEGIQKGDEIKIFGEYEWNDRGGVIHWTHHDPSEIHIGGWIEHKDAFYD